MRKLIATVTIAGMLLAACGGDDDTSEPGNQSANEQADDGGADDDRVADTSAETTVAESVTPSGLPAECVEAPTDIEFTMSASDTYTGEFSVESAAGVATPIVPNGDGSLDDLSIAEMNALATESPLLLYTQFIGDHSFTADDLGLFTGPEPPVGSITLGLTVVPTSPEGLKTGDQISSSDEIEYDAFTTFGTAGVFFQPADDVETYFQVNNLDETQGGTVDVLYVDDNWLCATWNLAGETRNPEGTYSLSGTLLTSFERRSTPFN